MRISDWSSDVCSSDLSMRIVSSFSIGLKMTIAAILFKINCSLFRLRPKPPCPAAQCWVYPRVVVICTGICQHRDTMNQTDDKVVPRTGSSPFRTVREREVERAEKRQDRKSTRLNSSH